MENCANKFERVLAPTQKCLQDGQFLFQFYELYPKDHNQHPTKKRFWLQHHKIETQKKLSTSYTLIQPTQFLHIEKLRKRFLPFTQWYNIQDTDSIIYGPFDFAIKIQEKLKISLIQKIGSC